MTTTADLDTQLTDLKTRLAAATRARVRAEAERDSAIAAAGTAAGQLREEFGITTVEEARAMLTRLESDLGTMLHELRQALDEIGV